MSYTAIHMARKDTRVRAERRVVEVSDHPCECGCGRLTMVSTKTDRKRGWVKGEPRRYVANHSGSYRLRISFHNRDARRITPERYEVDLSGGCWVWLGNIGVHGYARVSVNGVKRPAHRVAYEEAFGPIPPGMICHHRCENKACVNPEHLELLSNEAHSRLHGAVWRVEWRRDAQAA